MDLTPPTQAPDQVRLTLPPTPCDSDRRDLVVAPPLLLRLPLLCQRGRAVDGPALGVVIASLSLVLVQRLFPLHQISQIRDSVNQLHCTDCHCCP